MRNSKNPKWDKPQDKINAHIKESKAYKPQHIIQLAIYASWDVIQASHDGRLDDARYIEECEYEHSHGTEYKRHSGLVRAMFGMLMAGIGGMDIEPLVAGVHNEWVEKQQMTGWSYGFGYNREQKYDVNLVPYNHLREAVKHDLRIRWAIVSEYHRLRDCISPDLIEGGN